ncbi:hypothetical protein MBOU_54200 [Mycobacterium bourgelatii]|uniref:Uncharacterized protein n=2 Tax=Mycobacterium bourgelatii TaxID=1273442 RepID=A0A7I9YXP4_MYCBU|nr:hypothetical protein MBOU_54200 [Mycobacterium bourgelatii]
MGSVAACGRESCRMNRNKLLAIGAEIGMIAATILYLTLHQVWTALLSVALGAAVVVLVARFMDSARRASRSDEVAVGVGTVRKVDTDVAEAVTGERHIWIEVSSVAGDNFVGRLVQDESDPEVATLRPGLVVLVAFDPAERQELSLPDDVLAVRASSLVLA